MEKNGFSLIGRYRKAIMGAAALWILIFHEWQVVSEDIRVVYVLEKAVKRLGFCGVDVFFFLSGMGLVYAIQKYSVKTFYKRRIVNVYTPFLITAVIMAFLQKWDIVGFLKTIFFIDFYADSIYCFLWFLPAIFTFYFLFPWYYRLFEKASDKVQFTGCVLTLWLLLSVLLRDVMRHDLYGFTNRIPIFVTGILLGFLMQERKFVFTRLTWMLCLLLFILGVYFGYLTNYEDYYLLVPTSNCCVPNFLMAISGSCLLARGLLFADTCMKAAGKGILKVLTFLGEISLELYCVQEYVGNRMRTMLHLDNRLLLNGIVFAVIVCLAYVLHLLCRLIKKRLVP